MNKDLIIKNILEYISSICTNTNITNYVKKLIDINYDHIFDIKYNLIRACRYDEVLEINISNNYFTVYTTEWGTTSRRKVTFIKIDDNILLQVDNNEFTKDGFVKKNYLYKYSNNLLKHYKYLKKVNMEFKINCEVRKNYKNKMVDLYTISDDIGIKKIVRDNYTSCSIVNINDTSFNSLQLFTSVYLKNIEDISNEEYNSKIKLLK